MRALWVLVTATVVSMAATQTPPSDEADIRAAKANEAVAKELSTLTAQLKANENQERQTAEATRQQSDATDAKITQANDTVAGATVVIMWAAIVQVLVAIGAGIIAYLQRVSMESALKETTKAANAAVAEAAATQCALDETIKSNATAERAADAAQRSADVARDTLHQTQRASLHAKEVGLVQLSENNSVAIRVVLKNTGPTRALSMVAKLRIGKDDLPALPDFSTDTTVTNPSVVEGGHEEHIVCSSFFALSQAEVTMHHAGVLPLWIAGHVTYNDAFGIPHETDFGFQWSHVSAANGHSPFVYVAKPGWANVT